MTICHFISSQGLGRGEMYVDLVNSLCEYEKITLLVPNGAKFLNRVNPKIDVIEYKSKDTRNNPFLILEIFKIIKQLNPDVVHTHFAKSTQLFFLVNKILKTPHIATKHNPRKAKIFNKVPNVIAVSQKVKDSINNENIHIIYNGVTPNKKYLLPSKKNDKFKIIAVGRLEKIKGFDILIQALSKLNFDFELEIVGDGQELEKLQNLSKNLKIEKKINFLGFRTDVPALLNQADLQIISSHSEGFGIATIEGIFYAPVVISTKVGISDEILDENFLFEIDNLTKKIDYIFNNYETYKNKFKKIKEKSLKMKSLTMDKCVNEHINLYKTLA